MHETKTECSVAQRFRHMVRLAAGRAPISGEECVTLLCKRVMRWMQAAVRLAAGHVAEFLGTIKDNYSTR